MSAEVPLPEESMKEMPLERAFAEFWKDESLHDITFKADDGVTVGANRYALAIRSDVFRKMLLGRFKESSSNEVVIPYSGSVLESVVEYIHTDSAELLDEETFAFERKRKHTILLNGEPTKRIQNLVGLLGASIYYNLPALSRKTYESINRAMIASPPLSFAALEHCLQGGASIPSKLKARALAIMGNGAMEKCVKISQEFVAGLSVSMWEQLMADKDYSETPDKDQHVLFQLLCLWTEGQGNENGPHNIGDRKKVASELCAKHICLHELDPEFLSSSVEPSGLVTAEQLLKAFRLQALEENQSDGTSKRQATVQLPVWSNSGTTTSSGTTDTLTDMLNTLPVVKEGKVEWTIHIENGGLFKKGPTTGAISPLKPCEIWLGAAATDRIEEANHVFVEHETKHLQYCNNGNGRTRLQNRVRTAVTFGLPTFTTGSTVTLTLEIPARNTSGQVKLTGSVDGGEAFLITSSDQAYFAGTGFVPAVFTKAPARISLVGFKILD